MMIRITATKYGWLSREINIHVYQKRDALFLAKPPEFERIEEANYDPPPTFSLTQEAAQVLMDQLWDCGLRPSEGSGSAGALLATQKHLEDMRKAYHKLLENK